MLFVTVVYLRDITNILLPALHLNVSYLSIALVVVVVFSHQHVERFALKCTVLKVGLLQT